MTAQEVRAMVLDMQARLLLDMLGKGIESALITPSALLQEPWQASGETLSNIDPEEMAVDPALVLSIQVLLFWLILPYFIEFIEPFFPHERACACGGVHVHIYMLGCSIYSASS